MGWTITIDVQDTPSARKVESIPTPHLHVAIDSALYKHGLSSAKSGTYQITATAS